MGAKGTIAGGLRLNGCHSFSLSFFFAGGPAALLREEGKELPALGETGDKEHGSKYEKLRQESWEAVSQLLGTKPAK